MKKLTIIKTLALIAALVLPMQQVCAGWRADARDSVVFYCCLAASWAQARPYVATALAGIGACGIAALYGCYYWLQPAKTPAKTPIKKITYTPGTHKRTQSLPELTDKKLAQTTQAQSTTNPTLIIIPRLNLEKIQPNSTYSSPRTPREHFSPRLAAKKQTNTQEELSKKSTIDPSTYDFGARIKYRMELIQQVENDAKQINKDIDDALKKSTETSKKIEQL